MEALEILEFANKAMDLLPGLVAGAATVEEAVTAVTAHIGKTQDMVKAMQAAGNRAPTAEEWAYLDITSEALHKAVQAE